MLVAAALFQVVSGVLNIARWYAPMPFFFTAGHYWVAWLAIGALLVHVGVKLPVVRAALARRRRPSRGAGTAPEPARAARRAVGAAAGVITLATVGQTVRAAVRSRRARAAPPRHRTAGPAGEQDRGRRRGARRGARPVVPAARRRPRPARQPRPGRPRPPSRSTPSDLPIACVEGWSATATWTGVRLRDLVALVGADPDRATVTVESLEAAGRYRTSTVPPEHVRDPLTLVALRLDGEPLHLDHGYPARLIAPNRPGVLQTKWVGRITVRGSR